MRHENRTRRTVAALGALAALLSTGAVQAGVRPAPIAVYLEPTADGVVQGLAVGKVEQVLRERLARKKSIVLVAEPEQAALVLRLTECAAWGERRRVSEAGDRVFFKPGSETSYGVRTEHRTQVLLVLRATWGERFDDLASHDSDRNLKDAADSVADQLHQLVTKK